MLTHDPWQGGEGSSERRGLAITQNGSNLSPDAIWAFANNELIVSGPNGTAGIFATYPSGHLDMVNGFFDQVWLGTCEVNAEGRTALFWATVLDRSRISLSSWEPQPQNMVAGLL